MGFDTAYEAISEDTDTGHRWAFGTGFTDPLAGVDTTVPAGVDGADLAAYCLMLGDDALIMSHRLQQWLARAPELEEDTALANIALDLLGQARLLLTRAGTADGSERTEDDYAFGRGEREFRNVRLAEVGDADFAGLIARLLVFSTWRLALLARLRSSADPVLAAVAAQGVKELTYHRDYAAQWVIRLGDGTDYSRERMRDGLAASRRWCLSCSSRLRSSGGSPPPEWRWIRPTCGPSVESVHRPGARRGGPRAAVRPPAWRAYPGRPGGTACTPRRWATCWPSCRAWRGRCRGRHGERRPVRAGSSGRPAVRARLPRTAADSLARAREVAESVPDPELPMLTLDDLGILREVTVDGERVIVSLTPTYSGCPAMPRSARM